MRSQGLVVQLCYLGLSASFKTTIDIQVSYLSGVKSSKDHGPGGPALIIPREDLVCRHLTI